MNRLSTKIVFDQHYQSRRDQYVRLLRLVKSVKFDVSFIKYHKDADLKNFRKFFFALIKTARDNSVTVNYDDIRLQSIRSRQLLVGPQILQLNINNTCNYFCNFCLSAKFRKKENEGKDFIQKIMPFQTVKEIITDAYAMGVETIILSGDQGEPFLHPDMDKILAFVAEKKIQVFIPTNASLVLAALKRLKRIPLLQILVNLASVGPVQFERIHGASRHIFHDRINELRKLSRLLPLTLSFMIIRENFRDIPEYFKLAKHCGISNVRLRFPTIYTRGQAKLSLTRQQKKELVILLNAASRYASKNKILNNASNLQKELIRELYHKHAARRIEYCYNTWIYAKIRCDLKTYMCRVESEPLGRLTPGNSLENILFGKVAYDIACDGAKGFNIHKKRWRSCHSCAEFYRNSLIRKKLSPAV